MLPVFQFGIHSNESTRMFFMWSVFSCFGDGKQMSTNAVDKSLACTDTYKAVQYTVVMQ